MRLPVRGPGRVQNAFGGGDDLERLGHAAGAGFAVLGHLAGIGADDADAVGGELRQIALGRGRRPHMRIHRRRDQDRLIGCEQDGSGEIVGVTARHFRHQIGGRRRDDDEIGVAGETNMADIEFALRIEQIGVNVLAGERAGGERRNEMLRGRGENAAHMHAVVLQAANKIERFVGGNAAADDEKHAWMFGGCGAGSLLRRLRADRLPHGSRLTGRLPRRRLFRRIGRVEEAQRLAGGFGRGLAQDDADLVLHRPAVARRAQP